MAIQRNTAVAAIGAALVIGGGAWLALRMEREVPLISFPQELRGIGRTATWEFVAEDRRSGLRQVRAWVRQGEKTTPLLAEDFPSRGTHRRAVKLALDVKALGLAEGPATLVAAAQDHSLWAFKGNSVFREVAVTVDTQPPRLDVLAGGPTYVNRGGVGLVTYRLSEDPAVTGADVNGVFFPGYPEKSGGKGAYVAYFAFPHDAPAGAGVTVLAKDVAGNEVRRAFPIRLLEKVFVADTIDVSDRFLGTKLPEFRAADPALPADPVQAFLVVNREWRARDHQRIRELCARSAPDRLWSGAFLQMKNTKNMAGWAQRRTYRHNGTVIDSQTHLGLDLASTAGAPVPAANAGKVAFAGDLGIYGQAVLLDHGQGIFSLYGHLSSIAVQAGQAVALGDPVGASGQTGMAGGDHLHFSVLVDGVFVSPAEWLDAHWIADNVQGKLALFGAPAGLPPAAAPAN
jgi:hypothetical protein